jgi:enediyne polyketide synthase
MGVTLLFPGPYGPPAAQAAMLAESLAALRWLDRLGVTASAAVGYGVGEIAGLVWAGSLSAPEAARLVAQHGEVLSAMDALKTAMVRVAADEATARALGSRSGLAIAAYEAPRSHVLAGPVRAVRNVARQAAGLGIAADVLDAPHALHSPAMAPCAAPLRSVLAHIRFTPPRRRLVSTVTARELTPHDDIPSLLCAQLTSPLLFAEALRAATADADLLFVAGADVPLAASAAACCGLPVVGFPAGAYRPGGQQAAAPEPATPPAPVPQPVTSPAPATGGAGSSWTWRGDPGLQAGEGTPFHLPWNVGGVR